MQARNFSVSLNGTVPIAFNNPACRPVKGVKIDNEKWERDHWQERLYRDDNGRVIVPIKMLRKAAVESCSLIDSKPTFGKLKSFGRLVEDTWFFKGLAAKLEFEPRQLQQWVDFVNPNPKQAGKGGSGVVRIRPVIVAPWALGFTLQTLHEATDKAIVEEILTTAYALKGIGEGRKYMSYGRAEVTVTEFEEDTARSGIARCGFVG